MSVSNWKAMYGSDLRCAKTYKRKNGETVELAAPVYYATTENILIVLGTETRAMHKCVTGGRFEDHISEQILLQERLLEGAKPTSKHQEPQAVCGIGHKPHDGVVKHPQVISGGKAK